MRAKAFFAKGCPTRLAFSLARVLPPFMGRWVAALAARIIVLLKPDLYHTTGDNLRHVLGPEITRKALHRMLYRLFYNAARGYYEFFHNVGRGLTRAEDFHPPVRLTSETKAHIDEALASNRGLLILPCHMSNIDFGGIALSQYIPVRTQILSLADPPPGFELFNRWREQCGVWMTPINAKSLRAAIQRLREGGVVVTGPDRPIGAEAEGEEEGVIFFGVPSRLPTGYLRLPLRTDSLVMVLTTHEQDGVYWVKGNPPIEMIRTGDRKQDIDVNLRRILQEVEENIRRTPEQWMMFVPVWESGSIP